MKYIEEFKAELAKQGKGSETIKNYVRAVMEYARFVKITTGKDLDSLGINELYIREYKLYLLNVARQSPQTINNKLSGLSKFYNILTYSDTLNLRIVKSINAAKIHVPPRAPMTLSKNDLYKLRTEFGFMSIV